MLKQKSGYIWNSVSNSKNYLWNTTLILVQIAFSG